MEVLGCTDPEFCDFDPLATEDDGSCGEGDQVNDECDGALPLACGQTIQANNEECATVDDVEGCAAAQPSSATAGLWYSFEGTGGEVTVSTCYPGTTFDTYLSVYEGACGDLTCVAGNDDQSEPDYDDLCPVTFVASTVTMNTDLGQTYYVLVMGVFGESGDFEVGLSCVVEGCTDAEACNFNPDASIEDGSCEYPSEVYLDCEGNCLNDTDGDGVCDEEEVLGCTDESASNYNELATEEDGSCQYCELSLSTEQLQSVTCAGEQDAVVSLTLDGVLFPDSIEIYLDGVQQDTTVFEGLGAGVYTVEVFQGSDCSALTNFTVTDGVILEVSTAASDVLCNGESTGFLAVNALNGEWPYEFVLDGPSAQINDTGMFNDLPAGTYFVEVTDANGCSAEVEVEISEPEALTLSATITDADVAGEGAISLIVSGGTEPYEFDWTGDGGFTGDSQDIEGLQAPATYSVVVTDANGCVTSGGPYEVDDVYSVLHLDHVPFSVYPNPARDVIQLNMEEVTRDAVMTIYDASGRVMWTRSSDRWIGRFTVDVSGWASGTYHIQVATSTGVGHAPLVVQH